MIRTTGLLLLCQALGRPDLTREQAEQIRRNSLCTPGMNEAARLYYWQGMSVQAIADHQDCTRGPVVRRLKVWRERAKALLGEDEG